MTGTKQNLERFLEKIYKIQYNNKQKQLSITDFREIALEIGITESEWIELQKTSKAYLEQAKAFINYNNFQDAINELNEANSLNPNNLDIVYNLALCYYKIFETSQNKKDKALSLKYANNCLQISPAYDKAIKLICDVKEVSNLRKKKLIKYIIPTLVIIGIIVLIKFLQTINLSCSIFI